MVNLSQLESHLWESANILRGPVDAADFKTYVFPLLFFKRISDVHDEEYQAALAEAAGDEEYAKFSQNYRFQIPDDCHWADVRKVAANVGQPLFMAENLAGFAAKCPLAESLVMVIAGIGGKPLFAALAFPLMVFHIKHHRKLLCWHN